MHSTPHCKTTVEGSEDREACCRLNRWGSWALPFYKSAQLRCQFVISSQVVQLPCWKRSYFILVTSVSTISFLSLQLASHQKRGASSHPSPALPAWTLPMISWCEMTNGLIDYSLDIPSPACWNLGIRPLSLPALPFSRSCRVVGTYVLGGQSLLFPPSLPSRAVLWLEVTLPNLSRQVCCIMSPIWLSNDSTPPRKDPCSVLIRSVSSLKKK